MSLSGSDKAPFAIKDCALIAIATGKRAQNLRELRDHLHEINAQSIYYHFWGGLLRPRFDDPEYHNDFAIWVAHSVHDKVLAERLAVIDPVTFETLEGLRNELIETIEERLDEVELPMWARRDDSFEFIRSRIIVFDTKISVQKPEDFAHVLPQMSAGSIFYHFIDARQRTQNSVDDFQNWLVSFGKEYEVLRKGIDGIDPYFSSLIKLRDELTEVFSHYCQRNPRGKQKHS
jgi:hypothetical protein